MTGRYFAMTFHPFKPNPKDGLCSERYKYMFTFGEWSWESYLHYNDALNFA